MIGFQEPLDVNRRSTFLPEWLAGCEDPRPFHFAACNAMTNEVGVLEHGSDVKDGSESPPCEHLLKLRGDLPGGEIFGMKQSGQQDVHVAVPETGSDHEALAIDYGGAAWDFYGCGWPDGNNLAVMYENRAVLDWCLRGGGINSGPNQGKIRGTGLAARKEDAKDQKWVEQTASHDGNIRTRRGDSSAMCF